MPLRPDNRTARAHSRPAIPLAEKMTRIVSTTEVARDDPVQPEPKEHRDRDCGRRAEKQQELPGGRDVELAVADGHGQPERSIEQHGIGRHEDGALLVAVATDEPRNGAQLPR